MEEFLAEIKYRKKYGIRANLNHALIKKKIIPPATKWILSHVSPHTDRLPLVLEKYLYLVPKVDDDYGLGMIQAAEAWMKFLMSELMTIALQFEPIIID